MKATRKTFTNYDKEVSIDISLAEIHKLLQIKNIQEKKDILEIFVKILNNL